MRHASPHSDGHRLRTLTHKQLWLLGSNQPCSIDLPSMILSKEDLLAHSRYIRDTLAPRIAKDSHIVSGKHAFDLSHLRSALDELHKSPMTVEILSFSRIEKALQRIVEAHGRWPPDIVTKARDLIARWEESLGPLQRRSSTPAGSTGIKCNLGRAHKDGHSGFQIGDWWLNSAAACRDGIIDNPHYRVTCDEDVAYALVMTEQTETNVSNKDDGCSYRPDPDDPGLYKLMATINGEQRKTVRVLRSWKLQSSLAPAAGLRYDGLYRVTGYGVSLSPDPDTDRDIWRYAFHLRREPNQDHMEKALSHPSACQLDDWEDYRAGLTEAGSAPVDEDDTEDAYPGILGYDHQALLAEEAAAGISESERLGSVDSGYFSPHPEELGLYKK